MNKKSRGQTINEIITLSMPEKWRENPPTHITLDTEDSDGFVTDFYRVRLQGNEAEITRLLTDPEAFHWLPTVPDTQPLRQRVEPTGNGVEIPVDKTKYKIRFADETEDHVHVIIEPKE